MRRSLSLARRCISTAAITSSTERGLMDPRNYSKGDNLKDGTAVTVRSIRAEDSNSVLEAFKGMDKESVYRRFFSPKKNLSPTELEQLTDVDFSKVVALVVTTQSPKGELLIGGGRYAVEGPGASEAEIAFMTNGDYRSRHRVPHPETPRAHCPRGRRTAVRGGSARRKSAHARRVSAERAADATQAQRQRFSRNALAPRGARIAALTKTPLHLKETSRAPCRAPQVRPRCWQPHRPPRRKVQSRSKLRDPLGKHRRRAR